MSGDLGHQPPTDADRLARGALLQQGAQAVRLIGGLVVVTVLARSLTKQEFGLYAILLSFLTYVQFVKAAVMNAAVLGFAESSGPKRLSVVLSTGFALYCLLGVLSGVVLLGSGSLVIAAIDLPAPLLEEAHAAVVALAVVVALGWPLQAFDDVLRGLQRFAVVAAVELFATVAFLVGVVLLVLFEAPVSALVAYNASIPIVSGLACLCALRRWGGGARLGWSSLQRAELTRFGSISSYVVVAGAADAVTYSADRVILSSAKGTAAVGLYEGPLQVQNVIRYLNGILAVPAVPAARRYLVEGDAGRLHELFIKGLRYTLCLTLPFVVVTVLFADAILTSWLGPSFAGLGGQTAFFCAWWLIGANGAMTNSFLVAGGRFRALTTAAWIVAAVNLPLAVVLAPRYGISGVIVATVVALTVNIVIQLPIAMRVAGVNWRTAARVAWLPNYATAVVTGLLLWAVKQVVSVEGLGATLIACGAGIALYAALFILLWSDPTERQLALRAVAPRHASPP